MKDDESRIAVLEDQGRWIAHKLEKMDSKIDNLLEFKSKMYGAAAIIAFVVTTALEIYWRSGK